jgi:hypothetical protein
VLVRGNVVHRENVLCAVACCDWFLASSREELSGRIIGFGSDVVLTFLNFLYYL